MRTLGEKNKTKQKNLEEEWNLGAFCDFVASRSARGSQASPVSGFDASSQTLLAAGPFAAASPEGFTFCQEWPAPLIFLPVLFFSILYFLI